MKTIKDLMLEAIAPTTSATDRDKIALDLQLLFGVDIGTEHWDHIKIGWNEQDPVFQGIYLFSAIINSCQRQLVVDIQTEVTLTDPRFIAFKNSLERIPLKINGQFDIKNTRLEFLFDTFDYKYGGETRKERDDNFLNQFDSPQAIWLCPKTESYVFELADGKFLSWNTDSRVTSDDFTKACVPAFFNSGLRD